MTKDIDQRAQRHDPASTNTEGLNKPPGKIKQAEAGPDQIAAADAPKYNARDDGRGEVTTDDPVEHIKRAAEEDRPAGGRPDNRPSGTDDMKNPPKEWRKEDEESDESFPASDPPGNY